MGVDRYTFKAVPCRCGKGEFRVISESDDRPYARLAWEKWVLEVACALCIGSYDLRRDETGAVYAWKNTGGSQWTQDGPALCTIDIDT